MIDKKSELDSGKYIAVTRYLETGTIQSKRLCSVRLSNLEFYKKWSIENKIDFANSLAQPTK
jgi:non-specific serine/threonine protein kinase